MPTARLRVLEFSTVQRSGETKYNAKIQVSGHLHDGSPPMDEIAVYTHHMHENGSTWDDLMFVIRPHVQHMLNMLCSHDDNGHQCELAVSTAAAKPYAEAVLCALDPTGKHLRAKSVWLAARAISKCLEKVTNMPQAAVIMDDLPESDEGRSVWTTESERHALHIKGYVPFQDRDFFKSNKWRLYQIIKQVCCAFHQQN